MEKLYYGVGIDDSGKKNVLYKGKRAVWVNPCFQRWRSMLKRCYAPSGVGDQSYLAAEVCAEWLKFSAFEAWMLAQNWQGMEIDKDYLSLDKKLYSPETCAFAPKEINYFLGSSPDRKGDWPLGVSYDAGRGKYSAYIRIGGKSTGLGRYATPEAAHLAYQKAKLKTGLSLLATVSGEIDARICASMAVIFKKLDDDIRAGAETPSLHPINLPEPYKAEIADKTGRKRIRDD